MLVNSQFWATSRPVAAGRGVRHLPQRPTLLLGRQLLQPIRPQQPQKCQAAEPEQAAQPQQQKEEEDVLATSSFEDPMPRGNKAFPYPMQKDPQQAALSSIPWPLFYPAMMACVSAAGGVGFGAGKALPGVRWNAEKQGRACVFYGRRASDGSNSPFLSLTSCALAEYSLHMDHARCHGL